MNSFLNLNSGLNNCSGAEIHLKQDGSCSVRMVSLSISKKQIHIEAKKEYSGMMPEVLEKSDLEGPLAITVTGKGVLIKKTACLEIITEQSLQHLFPHMKLSEFYIQHFSSGAFSYIAVIRKEIAERIISSFKGIGLDVVIFSLGPFVADQICPQINVYGEILRFDGHQVIFDENKNWREYSFSADTKAEFPIKVDIEIMPEQFLLAYAVAFQLALHERLDLIEVEANEIKNNLSEFLARLKFKQIGMLMLVFFFVLLMGNFLLLSHYNSANQDLINATGEKSYVFENRQKLEEDVKMKEIKLLKLGWNKGFRYAYICDQIGQTVPKEIKLNELQINTLSSTTTGILDEPEPKNGVIRIKGQTGSIYAVNNWIYTLKDKSWVKEVKLEKYTADDQKQVQVFTMFLSY